MPTHTSCLIAAQGACLNNGDNRRRSDYMALTFETCESFFSALAIHLEWKISALPAAYSAGPSRVDVLMSPAPVFPSPLKYAVDGPDLGPYA